MLDLCVSGSSWQEARLRRSESLIFLHSCGGKASAVTNGTRGGQHRAIEAVGEHDSPPRLSTRRLVMFQAENPDLFQPEIASGEEGATELIAGIMALAIREVEGRTCGPRSTRRRARTLTSCPGSRVWTRSSSRSTSISLRKEARVLSVSLNLILWIAFADKKKRVRRRRRERGGGKYREEGGNLRISCGADPRREWSHTAGKSSLEQTGDLFPQSLRGFPCSCTAYYCTAARSRNFKTVHKR